MVTKIYQIKKYITRHAVEYIEHTATLVKKTIYSETKSNFCPSASLHLPPHHQGKIFMISKLFTSLPICPSSSILCRYKTDQRKATVLAFYDCRNEIPQTEQLKQQKFIPSELWRLEFRNPGFSRLVLSGDCKWESVPCFTHSFWWLPLILGIPWLIDILICLHLHISIFTSVSPLCYVQISLFLLGF